MEQCLIFLTGYQSVDDPESAIAFSKQPGNVQLPSTKELDNHEMIDAIHQGKLKAMYLFGEEMSLVDSKRKLCRRWARKSWSFS